MFWEVLLSGIVGDDEATRLEREYIITYKANDPAYGYNLTPGGQFIPTHARAKLAEAAQNLSDVTRLRMSSSAKKRGMTAKQLANLVLGRKPGQHRSPETLARMSESHKGQRHTSESRKKLSLALKGRPHSLVHRARIKAALARPVRRSDGQVFQSATMAAQALGLGKDAVSKAIREDRECQGFRFSRYPMTTPSVVSEVT